MVLTASRVVFIMLVAAVAMRIAEVANPLLPPFALLAIALGLALLVISMDVFIPQKSLLAISGLFFGLLVGMLVAYGISLVLNLILVAYRANIMETLNINQSLLSELVSATKIFIGVVCCYLAVSFILQTKDDVRFVIPYVEFSKQRKGQHPLILDTSVIIDGRITDVLDAWRVDAPVVIPRFVLQELQTIADSSDRLKRNRGRRGLDVVNKLQALEHLELQFQEVSPLRDDEPDNVDQRLIALSRSTDGRLVTNDYNLNKVAQIRGVEVININDLANALKPVFLPGESVNVRIVKPGEEEGQGIGYLEDGTMVVVEAARNKIGDMVDVTITSMLQTSAGKMIFGRLGDHRNVQNRPKGKRGNPPKDQNS
jgi:uncharacterized protein YacL